MPRSKGRTGRPWRRARARTIAGGDVCEICKQPVDKTLRFPHPGSPSVDHTTPLTRGGAEVDPANLKLAHLGCNSRKGNGTRNPQGRRGKRVKRDW